MVTDSNPHLEGLLDQHRIIYMPYSEEKNVVMELPCSPGLFFSSQLISGGELVIAFDRSLHKYWALHINQVYTPPKVAYIAQYIGYIANLIIYFCSMHEIMIGTYSNPKVILMRILTKSLGGERLKIKLIAIEYFNY